MDAKLKRAVLVFLIGTVVGAQLAFMVTRNDVPLVEADVTVTVVDGDAGSICYRE